MSGTAIDIASQTGLGQERFRRSPRSPFIRVAVLQVDLRPCGARCLLLGPGYLVAVGYMDPGNWATSLSAGSAFGYALLEC